MIIGAACGGLLGLVIGPLLARYRGIFFAMLTLALSMVLYGALVKSDALGGSDGFNVGRPTPARHELCRSREADFMLYALTDRHDRLCRHRGDASFRSESRPGQPRRARERAARRVPRRLGATGIMAINFVIAAFFGGVGGALALMSLRPYRAATSATGRPRASSSSSPSSPAVTASPRCSSPPWCSSSCARSRARTSRTPGSSRSACSCSLVILLPAARHRLALGPGQAQQARARPCAVAAVSRGGAVTPVLSGARARQALRRASSPPPP